MSGSKNEVAFKAYLDAEKAAACLTDIAESIRKGKVTVTQGPSGWSLTSPIVCA